MIRAQAVRCPKGLVSKQDGALRCERCPTGYGTFGSGGYLCQNCAELGVGAISSAGFCETCKAGKMLGWSIQQWAQDPPHSRPF